MKIPTPGEPQGSNYEGEGYIIFRHPDIQVVRDAVARVVGTVRVVLG